MCKIYQTGFRFLYTGFPGVSEAARKLCGSPLLALNQDFSQAPVSLHILITRI
jgi:hypothetical protein